MKKIFTFLICALSCGPALHSCNENTDRPILGLVLNNPDNDWRKKLAACAAETAAAYSADMDYILQQAKTPAEQAAHLTAMMEAGCKAVVIVPEGVPDPAAINTLVAAGIQVFLCDGKPEVNYAGLVAYNHTETGEKAGEWLAAQAGVMRAACFDIPQNQPVSYARLNGFRSKLGSVPSVTVDCEAYSREAGKAAALDLLADVHYTDVNAIYAQDDEVALGVLDALDETPDAPVVFVIGCGGSQAFFDEIKTRTGITLATTLHTPTMVGTSIEQAVQWLLNGTAPSPKDTYLPVTVVDAANVSTETPF